MHLLSKPYNVAFQLLGSYLSQLFTKPIRTKSITSCVIAALFNYVSQRMTATRSIDFNLLFAFATFGLLFGGTIPHYFYEIVSKFVFGSSTSRRLQILLIERLFFMPAYTFFSLYALSRFQGNNHEQSFDKASAKFPSVVEANLKQLSLLHYINIFFVPSILRVLVTNIITFFWLSGFYQSRK